MNEPWGVMGIVCPDEAPLLAFVSLVMPAIAMGNRVVAVPSASHPLSATDFYSVLDTSDVPAGVVNIVTGEANALAKTLAEHDGVDALWYVGDAAGAAQGRGAVRRQSQGDLGHGLGRRLADAPKAASSCAARPRSRTSGRLTANERPHQTFVTV